MNCERFYAIGTRGKPIGAAKPLEYFVKRGIPTVGCSGNITVRLLVSGGCWYHSDDLSISYWCDKCFNEIDPRYYGLPTDEDSLTTWMQEEIGKR